MRIERAKWIEQAIPVLEEHLVYVTLDCAGCERSAERCNPDGCHGAEMRQTIQGLLALVGHAKADVYLRTIHSKEAAK